MVYHVGAVVLVVPVRLDQAARVLGAGQQRVLPRLFRCKPIEFPTSPRMPPHRIHELRLGPEPPREQDRYHGVQKKFHVSGEDSIPPDDTGLHYNCDHSQIASDSTWNFDDSAS